MDLETAIEDLPPDQVKSDVIAAVKESFGPGISREDMVQLLGNEESVVKWCEKVGLTWMAEQVVRMVRQWRTASGVQIGKWVETESVTHSQKMHDQIDSIHSRLDQVSVPIDPKRNIKVDLTASSSGAVRIQASHKAMVGMHGNVVIPLSTVNRSELVNALMSIFYTCGAKGLKWEDATSVDDRDIRDNNVKFALLQFSDKSLKAHISGWRRWVKWCDKKRADKDSGSVDEVAPSRLQVSSFLQEVRSNGPTAAKGVIANFAWFEEHIGVPFNTEAPQLASFWCRAHDVQPSKKRKTGQAEVPPPSVYHRIATAISTKVVKDQNPSNNATMVFLAMVLIMIVGCVRYAHAQLSTLTKVTNRFMVFRCSEGKRKVDGVQEPFNWACPRIIWPGVDLWKMIQPLITQIPNCNYLFPDLAVSGWTGLSASTSWIDRPMPYEKFSKLWRGTLVSMNFCEEWIATFTTYSLRRWLPTIAGALQFSREQKQAIGNWIEVPNEAESSKERAVFPMSMRYDDDKDIQAGHIKGLAVTLMYNLIDLDKFTYNVTVVKEHAKKELEHLRSAVCSSSEEGDEIAKKAIKSWQSGTWQVGADTEPQVEGAAILKKFDDERKEPHIASRHPVKPSAKNVALEDGMEMPRPISNAENEFLPVQDLPESEDDDEVEIDDQFEHEYMIQDAQGKTARVHIILVYDGGWPIPACRSKQGPFGKWPKYMGWHPRSLPGDVNLTRCKECFKQLSDNQNAIWNDFV